MRAPAAVWTQMDTKSCSAHRSDLVGAAGFVETFDRPDRAGRFGNRSLQIEGRVPHRLCPYSGTRQPGVPAGFRDLFVLPRRAAGLSRESPLVQTDENGSVDARGFLHHLARDTAGKQDQSSLARYVGARALRGACRVRCGGPDPGLDSQHPGVRQRTLSRSQIETCHLR